MLLDQFLPTYSIHEVHSVEVHAPAEVIFRVLKEVTPGDVPAVGVLMGIRSLPALMFSGKRFSAQKEIPLFHQIVGKGFIVLSENQHEIVLGTIGRFWKPAGEFCRELKTALDFLDFREPGWVKVGWNFSLEERNGSCLLRTETRIQPTDKKAQRYFSAYWFLIRPGSGMIRKSVLHQVRIKAESKS